MKNKIKFSRHERGQALIIITFAIIGLIGLTGLTVDGGMAYSDRRKAQNTADSAAFAAALAHVRGEDLEPTAKSIATTNGYDDNKLSNTVTVTSEPSPVDACPSGTSDNLDITVEIVSHIKTSFATIVGIHQMTNTVSATTRACGQYIAPIFGGNAIVSLNPGPDCAFDSGDSNAVHWDVSGGGIFSNGCAFSKDEDAVTLDPDQCVATVGDATGGLVGDACTGEPAPYDAEYIASIMPPNPCTGALANGTYAGGGKVATERQTTFLNGVYCMDTEDKMNALSQEDVILSNATLYVTANQFDVRFSGGGGFSGTPTISGEYSSYYIIVADNGHPCTTFTGNGTNKQVLEYRGNGSGTLYGTILAPSACIDFRGNGTGEVNSQLIGYTVTSNGSSVITLNYVDDQNHRDPVDPALQLLK